MVRSFGYDVSLEVPTCFMNPWCKAVGDLTADRHHPSEAHDGDRGRPLRRHDARRRHDGGVPALGGLGECTVKRR